jgi:hypothetical protein
MQKNITIKMKEEYKKTLDRAAFEMSLERDERVPMIQVLYHLIDHYLDTSKQHQLQEMKRD